jgi:YVTN family beta-propeller protein
VPGSDPGSVSVISTRTNTVVVTIHAGVGPFGIAFTPNARWAYVTNDLSTDVSVINTRTSRVVDTIPVVDSPDGVAITPDGRRAYVSNFGNSPEPGSLSVIDTRTNEVTGNITVGQGAFELAIAPYCSRRCRD